MDDLDLLESRLEQAQTPLEKAETLVEIAWYLSPANAALALEQLHGAIKLFEPSASLNLWHFLQIARACSLIQLGKTADGFAILQSIQTAVDRNNGQLITRLMVTLLLYHFQKGNRLLARQGIDTCLTLLENLNPHDQTMVQHLVGKIYADLESNYPVAFKFYAQALAIARETGDFYYSFIIPANLADGFLTMGDPGSALMYLQESQQNITARARSLCRVGHVYQLALLGKAHLQKGDYDRALQFTLESLELEPEEYPPLLHGDILNNLGNIYLQKSDLLLAGDCFRQLQGMCGAQSFALNAQGSLGLARVSHARGNLVNAIARLNSAIQMSSNAGLPVIQMQAHEEIARAYAQRLEWQKAYEHQQQYHKLWVKNNDAGADRRTKTMEMMYRLSAAQSETSLAIQKNQVLLDELRQRGKAQESTQQRVTELEALRTTMEEIFSELELPNLLQKVVTRAVTLLDAQRGELSLFDATQNKLEVRASWPDAPENHLPGICLDTVKGRAQELKPGIVADYDSWELRNADNDQLSGQTILFVPLVRGSQFYGTLLVGSPDENRRFCRDDLYLLELFAHQTMLAIQNARLYSGVRYLAATDPLTGLAHRRSFFENARSELNYAHNTGFPVSLLMLDIDSFKNINDTYGHKAGDQMLIAVSQYMRNHLRKGDICGRIGGEEFAILLQGSNEETAVAIAERFRTGIAAVKVDLGSERISVTVSIGVATTNGDHRSLDHLFNRADMAMYRAKRAGKNQVSIPVEGAADYPEDDRFLQTPQSPPAYSTYREPLQPPGGSPLPEEEL